MTHHILQISKGNASSVPRKRVLDAVIEDNGSDDNVDGMDICNILENHIDQHRQTPSYDLKALGETIKTTLLEINEIREKNRERRHRELLQILTKMVQLENTSKNDYIPPKISTSKNNSINQGLHNSKIEDRDCLKKDFSNADKATDNCFCLKNHGTKLDENRIGSAATVDCNSSKNITESTKKELQEMRARMLELQRQKMADRERKKRKSMHMQNM